MENIYRNKIIKANNNFINKNGDIRVKRYGLYYYVEEYVKGWFSFTSKWTTVESGCYQQKDDAIKRAEKLLNEKNLPKEELVWKSW